MRTACIFTVFLFVPAAAFSDTIVVPDDYTTIQAAIDAAADGDIVLVKPGTYVENIDFKGKAITVKSESGPEVTIIDGSQSERVVKFYSEEGLDSVIDGFTLTNGNSGINCWNASSPTIQNNYISWNHSTTNGGGIGCWGSSSPVIVNNVISWNSADYYGGGIHCSIAHPLILNNAIFRNWSVEGLLSYGGGIWCDLSHAIMAGNLICVNKAEHGAGIYCIHSHLTLVNNTVYLNEAKKEGGGLQCENDSVVKLANSIFWKNSAPVGAEIYLGVDSILHTGFCDVKGGQYAVYVDGNGILNWGPGMINDDPLFIDAPMGDFHIPFTSPCVDKGSNSAPGISIYDFEGDPRIAYGTADMGADEFYTHLYYTGDATPGGSVVLKFVDLPGASPVGFWIAFKALDTPLTGAYGDWWLSPPMVGPFSLGSIPANGVYVLPGNIPAAPPGPYTLYLQAIMGTPLKLSNLCTMDVQ